MHCSCRLSFHEGTTQHLFQQLAAYLRASGSYTGCARLHLSHGRDGPERHTAGHLQAHIEKPCLACCIAPASTSHARVLQLSVGCSGPFRGVQARDCNLLQMGSASTSDSTSAVVAAQRKLRCTG